MKLEFSGQLFEKYSNIKFHENPSSGAQVSPCGQTDEQADTTKLMVDFRNLAIAPKSQLAGIWQEAPVVQFEALPFCTACS